MKSILGYCLLAFFIGTVQAAVSQGTLQFLTMPQSPAAIGRGGLYFDPDDADPLSVFTRPGQWGSLAERNQIMAGGYTEDTQWLPNVFSETDFRYSARAAVYGFNRAMLQRHFGWNAPVSLAVGYSEVNFDFGDFVVHDGNESETVHPEENAKGITIAGALQKRLWRFAAGLTAKYYVSDLGQFSNGEEAVRAKATGFAHDAGVQFHWNVVDALFQTHEPELNEARPFGFLSANYSMTNIGRGVSYAEEFQSRDPMSRQGILGFSAITGIRNSFPRIGEVSLLSVGAGIQAEDELIDRSSTGHYHYRNPLGGIQPYHQFLGGNGNNDIALKEGWEVSVFDCISIRRGEKRGGDGILPHKTEGFGLRMNVFLRLFKSDFIRRIDLNYDESTLSYTVPEDYWHSRGSTDTTYRQLSVGFRY